MSIFSEIFEGGPVYTDRRDAMDSMLLIFLSLGIFEGDPVYTDRKNAWDSMISTFDDTASTCNHLIHSMEMEEVRQERWLNEMMDNTRGWCVIAAAYASSTLQYESQVYDALLSP